MLVTKHCLDIFLFSGFITLLFSACTKSRNADQPNPSILAITSITPTHGPYSTIDTIYGSGFSANASEDSVFINGHSARIISAASQRLIVTIPSLTGTGNITVKVNGRVAGGPVYSYDTSYIVTTIAGTGVLGSADGPALQASFNSLKGIAVDKNGNVYVSDDINRTIRKISPTGIVSTLAGLTGVAGHSDGTGASARFTDPYGMKVDEDGNVYVTEYPAQIRKVTPSGNVIKLRFQ